MRLLVRIIFWCASALIGTALLILINFALIWMIAIFHIKSSPAELKDYPHVLILGAGNSPLGDWQNPTFINRMNAAVYLHQQLHLKRMVCSGKQDLPLYDEAHDMQQYLIQKGLPDHLLLLDEKGASTFQSIQNYAERFPGDSVIIVSQQLHLQRAIFIARLSGLKAKGFSAGAFRAEAKQELLLYESLARVKLWWEFLK